MIAALGMAAALAAPAAALADAAVVRTEHVRAELVAQAPKGVGSGKPLTLGLLIEHQPEWHTYWKNPGDSGLPTTLAWTLPSGVTAGEIRWPVPHGLPLGPLMNYGYTGTVLLPVQVTIPAGLAGGSLDIRLHAEWLVCKEICLPESGDFRLTLPANNAVTAHAAHFDKAEASQPVSMPGTHVDARVADGALALEVRGLPSSLHGQAVQVFVENAGVIEHAAKLGQEWRDGVLGLRLPLSGQRSESPATMQAVLVSAALPAGIRLDFGLPGGWPAAGGAVPAPAPASTPVETSAAPEAGTPMPLMVLLGFAFLGGALLNLMPCVFPVLSLKVFGFVQHAGDRRRVVAGGIAYTIGVVATFLALAAVLIGLRQGGAQLGWGFQLQSPLFVSVLAMLFTLLGLNLIGLFEFGAVLPSRLVTLRARHPLADDALSGALAVAVASPCTAPFMGASLGAALTLPTASALAIFAALGLGMAAPYLMASLFPASIRLLPRPGAWMLRFKTLMAFPMFATVIWLLWVLGQQSGIDAMTGVLTVLLALAFTVWTVSMPGGSRAGRVVMVTAGAVILLGAAGWSWQSLGEPGAGPRAVPVQASAWTPWSPEAVAAARQRGQAVFIDFTAAWCVTCQFNKRTTLADSALLEEFAKRRVVLLRADWTRRDPAITRQLAQYGRSGVPVYALYSPARAAPQLMSEILTVGEVRAALAGL